MKPDSLDKLQNEMNHIDEDFKDTKNIFKDICIIKDEVLLTVSCPIFPSILIAKNRMTHICVISVFSIAMLKK
jgi:hypothetical protein